eukprot:TRINITY_DN3607_c0_g2_i4.p2 TRINITY_DN3607_c0_g2~~TRINITY_DN3607_c0_g2_i4.p2  ORF type:complete len:138 (-),score=37.07 TRINITY_DN3607_c0_g2_i4:343-756(-)
MVNPLLLVDVGFGVTKACMDIFTEVPSTIYMTHNHSDHAAELPFMLSTQLKKGNKLTVLAASTVVQNLKQHRMAEFNGTGHDIDHWAYWTELPEPPADTKDLTPPTPICGGLFSIKLLRTVHSDPCFGFMLCAPSPV